jgi:hypothetical protein
VGGDLPKGAQFHVAAFTDDGMHVTDIRDSLEDSANLQRRLMAAIDEVGIRVQADVVIAPVHRLFTPGFTPTKQSTKSHPPPRDGRTSGAL